MTTQEIKWSDLVNKALTIQGSLGNTYNRFYNYSYGNQLLLLCQGVAEPVATYKKWQELGRQVKKGSKAKAILQPVIKEDETGETEIQGFYLRNCLFGLSETTGDELKLPDVKQWDKAKALKKLNIKEIPFKRIDGNVQGYANKNGIAINPTAVNPMKTLLHEIAHKVLGHIENQEMHRGIKEFQAECTAYLLMVELQLNTWQELSSCRAYIQGWLEGQKPTEQEIKQVFVAVDKILKAGRE